MKTIFFIIALLSCISSCAEKHENLKAANENFLKLFKENYPNFTIRKGKESFDFIGILTSSCSTNLSEKQYSIEDYNNISLIKNGIYSAVFYYEIVKFSNTETLNYVENIILHNNCLDENFSRIMIYKKIDDKTMLLCNLSEIDLKEVEHIINVSFQGDPASECPDERQKKMKVPVRID